MRCIIWRKHFATNIALYLYISSFGLTFNFVIAQRHIYSLLFTCLPTPKFYYSHYLELLFHTFFQITSLNDWLKSIGLNSAFITFLSYHLPHLLLGHEISHCQSTSPIELLLWLIFSPPVTVQLAPLTLLVA